MTARALFSAEAQPREDDFGIGVSDIRARNSAATKIRKDHGLPSADVPQTERKTGQKNKGTEK
jgi:hypothetical protein